MRFLSPHLLCDLVLDPSGDVWMRIEVLRIAIEPFSIVGIVESFQAFGDQIIDVFRSHAVDGDDDHSFALGLLHSLSYVGLP